MAQESAKQLHADSDDGGTSPGSVTFGQFVVSLASSAMVHMGEIPDPATGELDPNLDLARHGIDLLAVLQEKTMGNLDDEEAGLLETVLYDLRTRYLAAHDK